MVSSISNFTTSFVLGLLTPLTAVCVLPLYPGFLAYLSNIAGESKTPEVSKTLENSERSEESKMFEEPEKEETKKPSILKFGLIVTLGVIVFMFLMGLIFTTFFQVSLTKVIGIVSPIAFGILGIISIFLIFNFDFSRFMPQTHAPVLKNHPFVSAFIFGFFFGAIVIPCNPGFIAAFFTRIVLTTGFIANMTNFLLFGLGIGTPLLIFSAISNVWSTKIISYVTEHKRAINLIAGIIMLGISIYYLVFVFRVFG